MKSLIDIILEKLDINNVSLYKECPNDLKDAIQFFLDDINYVPGEKYATFINESFKIYYHYGSHRLYMNIKNISGCKRAFKNKAIRDCIKDFSVHGAYRKIIAQVDIDKLYAACDYKGEEMYRVLKQMYDKYTINK